MHNSKRQQQGNFVILFIYPVAALIGLGLAACLIFVAMPRQSRAEASAHAWVNVVTNPDSKSLSETSLSQYLDHCVTGRYADAKARGMGAGRSLVKQCLNQARAQTNLSPELIAKTYRQIDQIGRP